jgi:hypothetical protein
MATVITTNASEDEAIRYHVFGACHYENNGDDTYTVFYKGHAKKELYAFGYKLRDTDDLRGVSNAWISPFGTIYYVFWHSHSLWARIMQGMTASDLEDTGWCHYSYGKVANDHTRFTKATRESIAYLLIANDKNADLYI